MNITDEQYQDLIYVAIKVTARMDYRSIRKLLSAGVISCYRDLADFKRFKDLTSVDSALFSKIQSFISKEGLIRKVADGYAEIAVKNNIYTVSSLDKDYPYNFRVQSGMPQVFFARGRRELLNNMTIYGSACCVGARSASKYALYAAEKFSEELSKKMITIVSGMALGTDRSAHIGAIRNPGSTVAVLAGGCERIYPPDNRDIYEQLCTKGLILSEMPPGMQVLRQYFPSRNRLIAGLSDCCMIMEAGEISGTLHTASFAASQGKDVFVLPNSIYYDNARGGMKLLEDGASVLLSPDNVIDSIMQAILNRRLERPDLFENEKEVSPELMKNTEILRCRKKADEDPESMSDEEWKVLIRDELSSGPKDIDELCRNIALPFYRLSRLVVSMQYSGIIGDENGKYALAV